LNISIVVVAERDIHGPPGRHRHKALGWWIALDKQCGMLVVMKGPSDEFNE